MVEFTLVAPVLLLLGAAVVQYVLFFNARNLINHAATMAVRAGTVQNGRWAPIYQAYTVALVPLYGGGTHTAELQAAYERAQADFQAHIRIEWVAPTTAAFSDWADPGLSSANGGVRTIPNGSLGLRDPLLLGAQSGLSIQQSNVLALRITHGYELKVPLVASTLLFMLRWLDDAQDPFISRLYQQGRIPLVVQARLHMQSDVWEPTTTTLLPSADGLAGVPAQPGAGSQPGAGATAGPKCLTVGCTVIAGPAGPVVPTTPTNPDDPGAGVGSGSEICLQP